MAVTQVTCPHIDVSQVEVQTVRRVVETSIGPHGEWVTSKGLPRVVSSVTMFECGLCGWNPVTDVATPGTSLRD
jgi:hypothetical protein